MLLIECRWAYWLGGFLGWPTPTANLLAALAVEQVAKLEIERSSVFLLPTVDDNLV